LIELGHDLLQSAFIDTFNEVTLDCLDNLGEGLLAKANLELLVLFFGADELLLIYLRHSLLVVIVL